jgi:hypothetical protein
MKKYFSFLLLTFPVLWFSSCNQGGGDASPNISSTGTGGSLARFTISNDKLYVVDNKNLRTFDISQPTNPQPGASIPIGIGIETVFPYGNNLFIGASDAMYIYDITNPAQPQQLSRYQHFVGCDPVVVQGKYAYVTLRTFGCVPAFNNVLDVIDISDLRNPRVVNSLTLQSPYGLGIRGNALFVCEGDFGLKTFDATDPVRPVQKSNLTGIRTYDVIPLPASLLVVGSDGLYQYDYTNLSSMKLLSSIPVATP